MAPDVNDPGRVRRLQDHDFDLWRVLWAGYTSFYRADVPDHVTDLTFKRLCDGEQGMVGLVAVDADDQPVGLAHLVFHAATWSEAGYCYLEDLYVDPLHRGGQVARTLFKAVYQQARERGVLRVYWHTQQFNGPARSLYDTVGELTSFVVYEHIIG
jgi:GNAT superfamily N-acetyltransferase